MSRVVLGRARLLPSYLRATVTSYAWLTGRFALPLAMTKSACSGLAGAVYGWASNCFIVVAFMTPKFE